jgi:hypothetical protein
VAGKNMEITKFLLNPVGGDKIIDQYGVLWIYDARSRTWIDMGFLDVYGNVSSEKDGLVYSTLFEVLDSLDPNKFNCLKIADNSRSSFYYFYSADSTIKFKMEEHLGEKKLRAEVEQGTLARKFREIKCQGPKGERGDKGDQGTPGIPAPNEPTYRYNMPSSGLVDISAHVSTPIDTPVSFRLIRNQTQIAEIWVYEDGEVSVAFVDNYSFKDGTTYNIYVENNILYATFELDGDLSGVWVYKARQIGPRGRDGFDGNWFLYVTETEIPDDLIATDAVFEISRSGSDIAYSTSSAGNNICAHGLIPADPRNFKFRLGTTLLLAAKYMVPNCRNIVRWEYTKPEIEIPDLDMPNWTPTECCPKTRISPE